jgi:hypothetical protein
MDMTVPKGFRRGTPIPRVLQLHFANLPAREVERVGGVPVTGVLRAICDPWQSREVHRDMLRAAFEEGTRRGKITRKQIEAASRIPEGKELIAALRRMTVR